LKFINIIFFLISINVALFIASISGVWQPATTSPSGMNPEQITAIFSGALGYIFGTGGTIVLAQKILKLNVFSPEKTIGYIMLAGIWGSVTNLNASIINSLEIMITGINLSFLMNLVFGVIFVTFILQTIFGGFKSYE